MSTVQFPSSKAKIPDFEAMARSIKEINRSVPASSDGAYTYFADQFMRASTLADDLDRQITDAVTSLPSSLDNMTTVPTLLEKIGEIDAGERTGEIPTEKAATARAQLQARLGDTVSSTIGDFNEAVTKLSEPADRLSNNAKTIDVRLEDAIETATSNLTRASSDVERESARLKILNERYEKLAAAVDEARGGPTEDIVGLIPDKKELSSLLDVGAADAAAPEVAAAKKAIELAVGQIKKISELIDKTIKFTQLTEMRDEVFKAAEAQRSVTEATQERVRTESATLEDLDTFKATGASMTLLAAETNKLGKAFSSFAITLQDMGGKQITADTLTGSVKDMKSYLEQARDAHNNIILT